MGKNNVDRTRNNRNANEWIECTFKLLILLCFEILFVITFLQKQFLVVHRKNKTSAGKTKKSSLLQENIPLQKIFQTNNPPALLV